MIQGYYGLPGSGKTYSMVSNLYKTLSKKYNRQKRVYSNMHLEEEHIRELTEWEGELIYLYDIHDLIEAKNGIMLLDELNLWAPSRLWNKVPEQLLQKWAQVRKSGLLIFYTAQAPARVDKVIREITFESNHMNSFKMLGFFTQKVFIGIQDKFISFQFVKFNKKIAKCYDTEAEIVVPDTYKNGKGKSIKADNSINKELEKELEKIRQEKENKDIYYKEFTMLNKKLRQNKAG